MYSKKILFGLLTVLLTGIALFSASASSSTLLGDDINIIGTLTAGGNIGIGTTTPNWLLQAAGTRPSFALSDMNAAANRKHWLFTSEGGNLYVATSSDLYATSTPAPLTILNNGNVGIGTANPINFLHVTGSSAGDATFDEYSNNATGASFRGRKFRGTDINSARRLNTNDVLFSVNMAGGYAPDDATAAVISSDVVRFRGRAAENFTSTNQGTYFEIQTTPIGSTIAATRITIDNAGNVGIATTSPWRTLSVVGTMAITAPTNANTGNYLCWNTTTFEVEQSSVACSLSSIRYKENIRELTYGLNEVMRMHPIIYDTKPKYGTVKNQAGFIAEEAAKVVPLLVPLNKQGEPENFDYPKYTAVLTKAIQDQQREIEELKAEIEKLKK